MAGGVQYIDISADFRRFLQNQATAGRQEAIRRILRDSTFIRKLEAAVKLLIIRRTQAGYDLNGKSFPRLTYDKRTAFKYVTGKTQWASSSKSDDIQLSGKVFSGIVVKVKSVSVDSQGFEIGFDIDVRGRRNKEVANTLEARVGTAKDGSRYSKPRRQFLGLTTRGRWSKLQDRVIQRLFENELGISLN
jgi:hypothetical protein